MQFGQIHSRFTDAYSRALETGETENERVIWPDQAKQYYRFKELCSFFDTERHGLSILDIGCGNGEMVKFLRFNRFRGDYHGIDMHPGMVSEAQDRFPGCNFEESNVFDYGGPKHDFAVMSGVFNVQAGQGPDYVKSFLEAAAAHAKEGIAFNAISTHVDYREDDTFYLDPAEALKVASSISPRFAIRHGFLPYNFTVFIGLA